MMHTIFVINFFLASDTQLPSNTIQEVLTKIVYFLGHRSPELKAGQIEGTGTVQVVLSSTQVGHTCNFPFSLISHKLLSSICACMNSLLYLYYFK